MTTAAGRLARFLVVSCAALFACGCDGDALIPRNDAPREEIVRAQCEQVWLAAALFRDVAGRLPADLADTTAAGETLVDLLPGGLRLENAWTGERTEPRALLAPSAPGAIYYWSLHRFWRIAGHGIDSVVAHLDNAADLDAQTAENAYIVQYAVERFAAENAGIYPSDVYVDTTYLGYPVIDLLPGRRLLINAYTGARTEPVTAFACCMGEIGYMPYAPKGTNCGYTITCTGTEIGVPFLTIFRQCDGEGDGR